MTARLVRVGKTLALYAVTIAFARGGSLVLGAILARRLAREEFGLIALLGSLQALVPILVGLGMDTSLNVEFADSSDLDDRRRAATSFAITHAVGSAVALLVLWVAAPRLTASVGVANAWAIRLPASTIALGFLTPVAFQFHRLSGHPGAVLVVTAAPILATIVATVVAVSDARDALLAQAFGALVGLVTSASLLVNVVGPRWFDARRLRRMLGYGVVLVPTSVAAWGTSSIDRFFLERAHGLEAVGTFAVANTLAQGLSLIGAALQLSLWPYVLSVQGERDAPQACAALLPFYVALANGALLALGLFAREGVLVVAGASYSEAASVVPLLALAAVFANAAPIGQLGSLLAKRPLNLAIGSGLAVAASVGLNALLVPRFGAYGAGAAAALAQGLYAATSFALSRRVHPIPYAIGRSAAALAACVLVVAAHQALAPVDITPSTIAIKSSIVAIYALGVLALARRSALLGHVGMDVR